MKKKDFLTIAILVAVVSFLSVLVANYVNVRYLEPRFEKVDDDNKGQNASAPEKVDDNGLVSKKPKPPRDTIDVVSIDDKSDITDLYTYIQVKGYDKPIACPRPLELQYSIMITEKGQKELEEKFYKPAFQPSRPSEVKAVLEDLPVAVRRGEKIIDFGAGTGYWSMVLSKIVGNDGQVYAIDIMPSKINYLHQRVMNDILYQQKTGVVDYWDYSNVTAIINQPDQLMFNTGGVDKIFALYVHVLLYGTEGVHPDAGDNIRETREKLYQYIEKKYGKLLTELCAQLKDGGYLIMLDFPKSDKVIRLSDEQIKKMFEKRDMYLVKVKVYPKLNDNVLFLFQKKKK